MPLSNAERQARWRGKHPEVNAERIRLWKERNARKVARKTPRQQRSLTQAEFEGLVMTAEDWSSLWLKSS